MRRRPPNPTRRVIRVGWGCGTAQPGRRGDLTRRFPSRRPFMTRRWCSAGIVPCHNLRRLMTVRRHAAFEALRQHWGAKRRRPPWNASSAVRVGKGPSRGRPYARDDANPLPRLGQDVPEPCPHGRRNCLRLSDWLEEVPRSTTRQSSSVPPKPATPHQEWTECCPFWAEPSWRTPSPRSARWCGRWDPSDRRPPPGLCPFPEQGRGAWYRRPLPCPPATAGDCVIGGCSSHSRARSAPLRVCVEMRQEGWQR